MPMTFEEWREAILTTYPGAEIIQETGACETYGEVGVWSAFTGPDRQADFVGYWNTETDYEAYEVYNITEFKSRLRRT